MPIYAQQRTALNKKGAYLRCNTLAACQSLSIFHIEYFSGRKVLKKWPKVARKTCLACPSAFGCFKSTVEQRKMKVIDSQNLHLSSSWTQ